MSLCPFEIETKEYGKLDPKMCPSYGKADYCKFNPQRGLMKWIKPKKE